MALGPKPRSYRQRTPKKMVRLALRSALSDRARDEKVVVVDRWRFESPRTKDAIAALAALKAEGRVLLVAQRDERDVWKSFGNLPQVHLISPDELNAYAVLVSDGVVFTLDTLPSTDRAETEGDDDGPGEAADDDGPGEAADDDGRAS